MIRGTTPTHALQFEDGILNDVVQILVSYKQDQIVRDVLWAGADSNAIQVDKEDSIVYVEWSQEDTAKFRPNRNLMVQVRIVNTDMKAAATAIVESNVLQVLNDSLLGGAAETTIGWTWVYDDLTADEIIELAAKLDLEVDDPDEWDTKLTAEEAREIADMLGVPYTPDWDRILSSVESAEICALLGLINN